MVDLSGRQFTALPHADQQVSNPVGGLSAQIGPGLANMNDPTVRRLAATNVANFHDTLSEKTKAEGRNWYPAVHEAVAKGIKGTSMDHLAGSGLVAAVSPGMDFENRNIHAFKELHAMGGKQWDTIHESHARQLAAKAAGQPSPGRTPEASAVLQGKSISQASDSALVKANRIMQGEHVDSVLNPRTAPKTNAFAHNINDPDDESRVTIDGRAHDIATNRMIGWQKSRGIGASQLPSGKPTRYEHFVGAYQTAAKVLGEKPSAVQANTWVGGKEVEMRGTTKSGQPRKVGVRREGQPYL